jgi:DNA helicase IV
LFHPPHNAIPFFSGACRSRRRSLILIAWNLILPTHTEPRLFAWLCFRPSHIFEINATKLIYNEQPISYLRIHSLSLRAPWLLLKWLGAEALTIGFASEGIKQNVSILVSKEAASHLLQQAHTATAAFLLTALQHIDRATQQLTDRHAAAYKPDRYVRHSVARRFAEAEAVGFKQRCGNVRQLETHSMLSEADRQRVSAIGARLHQLTSFIEQPEIARKEHNHTYALHARVQYADYFARVESKALTDEQIDAALTFEDATLVVAAAGSGKSSCIIGKIGFALKSGLFAEQQILALAYNKEAAKQLKKRLDTKLSIALGRTVSVAAQTFHGFGLRTLMRCYGDDYEPKVLKEEGSEEGRYLKTVISSLVKNNPAFQQALADWISLSPYDDPQPVGFSDDLDECEKRYEECCRERMRERRDPTKKPWQPSIPTFNPAVHVRSLQERSIVNWLTTRNIAFDYEQPDWKGAERLGLGMTDKGKQKPYKPDFTYTYSENWRTGQTRKVRVVHEHFALDAEGNAPIALGGEQYAERAAQKRAMYLAWMHEASNARERVVFIETTSAQIYDGSIWAHLAQGLQQAGVPMSPPDTKLQSQAIESFRESGEFETLIIDFVLRFKDSGRSQAEIRQEASTSRHPYRALLFLRVAFAVYEAYEAALNADQKIDFADMLRDAIDALKSNRTTTPYRFLLVDEFQDIAKLKADLVKAVLEQASDTSILFCVGDDWQTINRFAGSDVSIFTNVGRYFNRHTQQLNLTRTFRCAQGIADVSRALVMHNEGQFDKAVNAEPAQIENCVRVVLHGANPTDRKRALTDELERIAGAANAIGVSTKPTVQVLRRTQADTTSPEGLDNAFLKKVREDFSDRLEIVLDSIHGSKGREADFVILPGLDSGFRGFPDERPPETMLNLVLPRLRDLIEEERRLMYVGLTRARHQVVVLACSEKPSQLILELDAVRHNFPCIEWIEEGDARIPCPVCNWGSMVIPHPKFTNKVCSRTVACGYRESKQPAAH